MANQNNNWAKMRFLGAELIVVVVGVIIALGIEAWWSDLQEAEREQDHLVALRDEFTANRDTLQGNIARLENIQGAAGTLLTIMVGEAPRPSPDSLVSIVWEAFSFPPYEPLTTAYDNLISTGDIALLGDEALKRDLALFMSEVEHYRRGEGQMEQWHRIIQQFIPTEMVPLDWLPSVFRDSHRLPQPTTRTDWDRLFRSREFEGILVNRVIGTSDNINNLNRVLQPVGRIVERLDLLLQRSRGGAS